MLKVIFTLDYEIHGNGEGSPRKLMIEPTQRILRLFDKYGAKLTIMADTAEILKFKEYAEQHKMDDYNYGGIVSQLRDAVVRGHDAQLHIHASYVNAVHDGRHWVQCWEDYDFANLSLDRMTGMIRQGKEFLESILRPVNSGYRCFVFRAANWSVSPSANVVKALQDNGFKIETSIFKYGRRDGIVNFDYSGAYSNLVPWRASEDDLCVRDDGGKLWEFPIYSENRWIGAFLTPNRVFRVAQSRTHAHPVDLVMAEATHPAGPARKRTLLDRVTFLAKGHAWKADFNQCTGRQLIGALLRAERQASLISGDIPFVLIGHSKLFNSLNERSLRPFLEFVAQNNERFRFETFGCFQEKIEHRNYLADRNIPGASPIVYTAPIGIQRSHASVTSG
jgi:peptidoglycan/xylan/chitin deacetylase (PgdA/CDA1 family)